MAFARVNSNSGANETGTNGTTITTSLTSVTAGHPIVVWVKHEGADSVTISVSDGTSSFTSRPIIHSTTANTVSGQFFYLLSSVASGSVTYTATFNSGVPYRTIAVYELSAGATAAFDVSNGSGADSDVGNTITSGTVTVTAAPAVAFGGYGEASSAAWSAGKVNGVAADHTQSVGTYGKVWMKTLSATFSGGAATATLPSGNPAVTGILVLKEDAGASNTNITPSVGSLALTGAASLLALALSAGTGSAALTGVAPSLVTGTQLTPSATTLVLSGTSSALGTGLVPGTGAVSLTGVSPELNQYATPSVGSLVLTGASPTISLNTNSSVSTDTGALHFGETGSSSATPVVGSLSLTTAVPGLPSTISPSSGAVTLASTAGTASVSTRAKFYLQNLQYDGWQGIDTSGGSASSNTFTGWTVGTGSINYSAYSSGVERAASTFADTTPPSGTLDTALKDAFRSSLPISGSFDAGYWDFYFVVRALSNASGQDGRMRLRVLKAQADGSSATELTSGQVVCSIVTDVTTSTDFTSTASISLPATVFSSSEYLFIQLAWERTGAASNASADINLFTGTVFETGTKIYTSSFTATASSPSIRPSVGSLTLTGLPPDPLTFIITPSSGSVVFGISNDQTILTGTGSCVFQSLTPGISGSGAQQITTSPGAITFAGQQAAREQARITPSTSTLKITQWARIAWTANTEPDLAGYNVYRGTVSGSYTESRNVGNVTSYVWEGLTYGNNYFVVTAYDSSDNESTPSSEVVFFISGGGWAPSAVRGSPRSTVIGSLTLTGSQPNVVQNAPTNSSSVPSTGSLVFNGQQLTILPAPLSGDLSLTGLAPTVSVNPNQVITPTVAALTLTGTTPVQGVSLETSPATVAFNGRTAVLGAAAFTLREFLSFAGYAPYIGAQPYDCADGWGLFHWGFVNWCSSANPVIRPTGAALTLTGSASTLSSRLSPLTGALVITGGQSLPDVGGNNKTRIPLSAELLMTETVPRQDQGVTITGTSLDPIQNAPGVLVDQSLSPGTAALTLTGQAATASSGLVFLSCAGNWGTFNWGGVGWCSERYIQPFTTDLVDEAVYYLSVELTQQSNADFVIASISPGLNINAQLPAAYQTKVDVNDIERLSVELRCSSNDDFVIQTIRPVMNLRKKSRSHT